MQWESWTLHYYHLTIMLLSTGLIGLHHHLTFQSLFHSLQVCYPIPCQLYDWSLYKLLYFLLNYPTLHYTQTNTYTHVHTYIHVHTNTDKQTDRQTDC